MFVKAWEMNVDNIARLHKIMLEMQSAALTKTPFRNSPVIGLYFHMLRYYFT